MRYYKRKKRGHEMFPELYVVREFITKKKFKVNLQGKFP